MNSTARTGAQVVGNAAASTPRAAAEFVMTPGGRGAGMTPYVLKPQKSMHDRLRSLEDNMKRNGATMEEHKAHLTAVRAARNGAEQELPAKTAVGESAEALDVLQASVSPRKLAKQPTMTLQRTATMTESHEQKMERLLRAADMDGDGDISPEEFQKALEDTKLLEQMGASTAGLQERRPWAEFVSTMEAGATRLHLRNERARADAAAVDEPPVAEEETGRSRTHVQQLLFGHAGGPAAALRATMPPRRPKVSPRPFVSPRGPLAQAGMGTVGAVGVGAMPAIESNEDIPKSLVPPATMAQLHFHGHNTTLVRGTFQLRFEALHLNAQNNHALLASHRSFLDSNRSAGGSG